jgi:hypothetical protein
VALAILGTSYASKLRVAAPAAPALAPASFAEHDQRGGMLESVEHLERRAWVAPIPSPAFGLTLTSVPEVGSILPIMGAAYALPSPTNYKACILVGNNFTNPGVCYPSPFAMQMSMAWSLIIS